MITYYKSNTLSEKYTFCVSHRLFHHNQMNQIVFLMVKSALISAMNYIPYHFSLCNRRIYSFTVAQVVFFEMDVRYYKRISYIFNSMD